MTTTTTKKKKKKKTKKGGKGGQRSNDLLKHMAKELRRAHDKEINYTGASPPPPLRLELNTNKCNYFRLLFRINIEHNGIER